MRCLRSAVRGSISTCSTASRGCRRKAAGHPAARDAEALPKAFEFSDDRPDMPEQQPIHTAAEQPGGGAKQPAENPAGPAEKAYGKESRAVAEQISGGQTPGGANLYKRCRPAQTL